MVSMDTLQNTLQPKSAAHRFFPLHGWQKKNQQVVGVISLNNLISSLVCIGGQTKKNAWLNSVDWSFDLIATPTANKSKNHSKTNLRWLHTVKRVLLTVIRLSGNYMAFAICLCLESTFMWTTIAHERGQITLIMKIFYVSMRAEMVGPKRGVRHILCYYIRLTLSLVHSENIFF